MVNYGIRIIPACILSEHALSVGWEVCAGGGLRSWWVLPAGGAMHGRRAGNTFVFVEHGPKYLIV